MAELAYVRRIGSGNWMYFSVVTSAQITKPIIIATMQNAMAAVEAQPSQ